MKQRIREKDSHTHVEVKCVYCGLKSSTCEALKKLSLDNITIPEFTKLPITSKSEVFYCCSDCKQAILDSIWDNVLYRSPKKNKLGLFFDLNEYVTQFVVTNQRQLVEIAHDYQILFNISQRIDTMLNDITVATGEDYSDIVPVLPSKMRVAKLIQDVNNDAILMDRCYIDISASSSCIEEEFFEICSSAGVPKEESIKLKEAGVDAAIEGFLLIIRPELYYNKDVEIRKVVICVDTAKYMSILKEHTQRETLTCTSSIKPTKKKSPKISGGDIDFGTGFKID